MFGNNFLARTEAITAFNQGAQMNSFRQGPIGVFAFSKFGQNVENKQVTPEVEIPVFKTARACLNKWTTKLGRAAEIFQVEERWTRDALSVDNLMRNKSPRAVLFAQGKVKVAKIEKRKQFPFF